MKLFIVVPKFFISAYNFLRSGFQLCIIMWSRRYLPPSVCVDYFYTAFTLLRRTYLGKMLVTQLAKTIPPITQQRFSLRFSQCPAPFNNMSQKNPFRVPELTSLISNLILSPFYSWFYYHLWIS